jgi:hypothetical protein
MSIQPTDPGDCTWKNAYDIPNRKYVWQLVSTNCNPGFACVTPNVYAGDFPAYTAQVKTKCAVAPYTPPQKCTQQTTWQSVSINGVPTWQPLAGSCESGCKRYHILWKRNLILIWIIFQ